jgi:hypothetical protein
VRYKIGDLLLDAYGQPHNARKPYQVYRVTYADRGTAIAKQQANPPRVLLFDGTQWTILVDGQEPVMAKTFEEGKLLALYPNVLDRMAAIDRHGRKSERASKPV